MNDDVHLRCEIERDSKTSTTKTQHHENDFFDTKL